MSAEITVGDILTDPNNPSVILIIGIESCRSEMPGRVRVIYLMDGAVHSWVSKNRSKKLWSTWGWEFI